LVTVKDFHEKMIQFSENDSTCTTKHLKKLLKEKYGAFVFFSEGTRESNNVICFQDMANYIVNKKLKDKKDIIEDESKSIIKAAADLIISELREMKHDSQ